MKALKRNFLAGQLCWSIALVLNEGCANPHLPRNCEAVPIPETWRLFDYGHVINRPDHLVPVDGADAFAFRTLDRSVGIAVQAVGLGPYTYNKFKFSPDNPNRMEVLSDNEWQSARKNILSTDQKVWPGVQPGQYQDANSAVIYKGKSLRFSGKELCDPASILLSRSGSAIALESCNVDYRHANALSGTDGTLYVDVFNVSSGARLFSLSWFGRNPNEETPKTLWITDRHFVLDLSADKQFENKQKFIICDASKLIR